jgi:hypothetical protein
MKAAFTALTSAACMFGLLISSEFASAIAEGQKAATQLAQQGEIMTARASSNIRADAWQSAIDKAWNLCMIRGLYNITRVSSDCAQNDTAAALAWECVGTAACQK